MDIDVSKVKRTRDGHKVRIYANDGNGRYPIHGAILGNDGVWSSRSWTNDGMFCEGVENRLDLIEERRTIELDFWLNVSTDGSFCDWDTREDADKNAEDYRIACLNIKKTVTEGEGL